MAFHNVKLPDSNILKKIIRSCLLACVYDLSNLTEFLLMDNDLVGWCGWCTVEYIKISDKIQRIFGVCDESVKFHTALCTKYKLVMLTKWTESGS